MRRAYWSWLNMDLVRALLFPSRSNFVRPRAVHGVVNYGRRRDGSTRPIIVSLISLRLKTTSIIADKISPRVSRNNLRLNYQCMNHSEATGGAVINGELYVGGGQARVCRRPESQTVSNVALEHYT
jgi:hypothetical protein